MLENPNNPQTALRSFFRDMSTKCVERNEVHFNIWVTNIELEFDDSAPHSTSVKSTPEYATEVESMLGRKQFGMKCLED